MNNSMQLFCAECDTPLEAPLFVCPKHPDTDPDRMVKAQQAWEKENKRCS